MSSKREAKLKMRASEYLFADDLNETFNLQMYTKQTSKYKFQKINSPEGDSKLKLEYQLFPSL